MISAAQLRAARGLLDWTRSDLAKAANISPETIKNIEHGTFRPQENTAEAIVRAFGVHSVLFTEDDGVKIDRNNIKQYSGVEDFKRFMDDVYMTALNDPEAAEGGKNPICVSNVDDRLFAQALGADYTNNHTRRMSEIKNLKVRVLVEEHDFFSAPNTSYVEYRWNVNQSTGDVPFYVYGDKFAILMFTHQPSPQIVVITSKLVSGAYRDQFEVLWKNSKKREKIAKE
ncbi:MAG: helix-turn-helix transcriptional regulator [Alphaproteobacteria bacterium]